MSQKRTTTYSCDKCGKDVPRKRDLRRFTVQPGDWLRAVAFDVCVKCEAVLIEMVAEYVPDDVDVSVLSREVKP